MRPVIYLSTFFPPENQELFMKGLRSGANLSASAFSYALLSGFAAYASRMAGVMNAPPVGPFPFSFKRMFCREVSTEEYGMEVRSIATCNIYGLQALSTSRNLLKAIQRLGAGESSVLVYSAQIPLLRAAVDYKKSFPGTRIILIVPDLYEDISSSGYFKSLAKKRLFGDFDSLCQHVDAYVLLTDQMIERMPVRKPYCVVEGVYNLSEQRVPTQHKPHSFTILYSGMLYERFGVKNLVDAFCSLSNESLRLQLCGSGDLEGYIKDKAAEDPRIEFLGVIPRKKALELQCSASLLVNPRQPNGGFTRYSFPSKNIEYLASGTPALIYELEGIPQEYYNYCYHLSAEQSSVKDLADIMQKIYNEPIESRVSLAASAREFILTKKNAPAQCEKILRFIDSLE